MPTNSTATRLIPLTGTEAQRVAASINVLTDEIHSTNDQRRFFLENDLIAPIWHGTVANTAARITISSTFGVWPGDEVFQTDDGKVYRCITNNGQVDGDWFAISVSSAQPLDSDLTAIAALTTTAFGRGLLILAAAINLRDSAELNTTDTPQFSGLYLAGASNVPQLKLADSVLDASVKDGWITVSNYTNVEESLGVIKGRSASAANANVDIGGDSTGIGVVNAATRINFLTGATASTINGTVHAFIDFAGRFSIKKTTPSARLDVAEITQVQSAVLNLSVIGGSAIGDGAAISFLHSSNERSFRIYARAINTNRGELRFASASSFSGYEDRMTIDQDGNVGIGTTIPESLLTLLDGAIRVKATSTAIVSLELGDGRSGNGYAFIDLIGDATFTDWGIRLIRGNTGANTNTTLVSRGTGAFLLGTQDAGQLVFRTNNVSRARFSSTGNFLIATTAVGTNAVAVISLGNATAPTSSPANGVQLYAEDVSASSELKVRDEVGNISVLSPHAKDAPAFMYDIGPGADEMHRVENAYLGTIIFTNETRKNALLQLQFDGDPLPEGNARVFTLTETFQEYNARKGTNIEIQDWDTNQDIVKAQKDQELVDWTSEFDRENIEFDKNIIDWKEYEKNKKLERPLKLEKPMKLSPPTGNDKPEVYTKKVRPDWIPAR